MMGCPAWRGLKLGSCSGNMAPGDFARTCFCEDRGYRRENVIEVVNVGCSGEEFCCKRNQGNGTVNDRGTRSLHRTAKCNTERLSMHLQNLNLFWLTIKSQISYSEESGIGLIILAIAFIFEEDLVKYELVDTRCVISNFFSPLGLIWICNFSQPFSTWVSSPPSTSQWTFT